MHRIKRFIFFASFFLLSAFSTVTALAAEDSTEKNIDSIKSEVNSVVGALSKAGETETAEKLSVIVTNLDSVLDGKELDIDSAYETINEVLDTEEVSEKIGGRYTDNYTVLEVAWKNALSDAASAYGYNKRTYTKATGLFGKVALKDEDTKTEDTTNSSAKYIQMLTWTASEDSAFGSFSISTFLRQWEITFGTLSNILMAISASLLIAFGCSNLLRLSQDRMVSSDAITREFAKLLFGLWFIFNYKYFTILILRVGTAITEIVLDPDGSVSSSYAYTQTAQLKYCLWASLRSVVGGSDVNQVFHGLQSAATGMGVVTDTKGIGEQALSFLGSLFGGVLTVVTSPLSAIGDAIGGQIINLAIGWVVYALLIEIGIRYVFTPIAIADLYSEGYRSSGTRWLKKLFACCMTGAIMYLMIYGTNALKATLPALRNPIIDIAINLTMCGGFIRSRQLADEILGIR